jgi:hypothetical protein
MYNEALNTLINCKNSVFTIEVAHLVATRLPVCLYAKWIMQQINNSKAILPYNILIYSERSLYYVQKGECLLNYKELNNQIFMIFQKMLCQKELN